MTEICPDQHLVKARQTVPDIGAVPILLRALQLHTLVSGTVRLLLQQGVSFTPLILIVIVQSQLHRSLLFDQLDLESWRTGGGGTGGRTLSVETFVVRTAVQGLHLSLHCCQSRPTLRWWTQRPVEGKSLI